MSLDMKIEMKIMVWGKRLRWMNEYVVRNFPGVETSFY